RIVVAMFLLADIRWSPGLHQEYDLHARMADVLRYTGVGRPAPDDVARMTELWTRAQQTGLTREERRLAFRDMQVVYARLHGRDLTATPQALDGLSQYVMTIFDGGGKMNL